MRRSVLNYWLGFGAGVFVAAIPYRLEHFGPNTGLAPMLGVLSLGGAALIFSWIALFHRDHPRTDDGGSCSKKPGHSERSATGAGEYAEPVHHEKDDGDGAGEDEEADGDGGEREK